MQMFRLGRKESAWMIERDEGCCWNVEKEEEEEEKEKMGVCVRRAKGIREDRLLGGWKGETMEHGTGREGR